VLAQERTYVYDHQSIHVDTPFDILEIEPDADDAEIDRAYRQRVKKSHPDHGGSISEFQRVRTAYQKLKTGDWTEVHGTEHGIEDEPQQREESRVEYLNYEALDDYGWAIDDENLFGKAAAEGLDSPDYGQFLVQPHESLLEAAENRGFAWPFACRGGACANCAIAVIEGEMSMPVNHVLPAEIMDRGIRLSCNGMPTTEEMKVVYNVKHLPDLDDLRLPPRPFEQACLND
jgi:ferredoxin